MSSVETKKMMSVAQDILEAAAVLAEQKNLQVTLTNCAKGALIAGIATLLGGLLGGKKGLVVGGVVGGISAAAMLGEFKSVGEIIRQDLNETQRQKLYHDIVKSVSNVEPADVAMIVPMIMGSNPKVQQAVLQTINSFIKNEMQMSIVD